MFTFGELVALAIGIVLGKTCGNAIYAKAKQLYILAAKKIVEFKNKK